MTNTEDNKRLLLLGGGAAKEDDASRVLAGLVPSDDTMRWLWHLTGEMEKRLPPRDYFGAVIFGSARAALDSPQCDAAYRLGFRLAESEIDVITGGGPSVMERANAGAIAGRKAGKVRSIGLHIELVEGETPNTFLSKQYLHRNFFTRLHHFARLGNAFVVMDGGIGSALELFVIWQLLQKKHLVGTPLILVGDMWPPLLQWVQTCMIDRGYASPEDIDLVLPVANVDDAFDVIMMAYRSFKQLKAAG